MASRLCSRLPWLSITPRGVPVLPDVYCRKASVSAVTSGRFHAASAPASSASVATHFSARSSGASVKRNSAIDRMTELVSTTVAPESAMSARRRGRVRSSRDGSGGYAGTATNPEHTQPKKPAR
ncbi:hypothetical protein COSO111634_30200 [Corallococcus soli]